MKNYRQPRDGCRYAAYVGFFSLNRRQFALATLPERRHLEQTDTGVFGPFTTAFTFRILGFQTLHVFLLEWETL